MSDRNREEGRRSLVFRIQRAALAETLLVFLICSGAFTALALGEARKPWPGFALEHLLLSVGLAALLVPVAWRLSGLAASGITYRLERLSELCSAISAGRVAELSEDASADEIGALSRALVKACAAYAQTHARLERQLDEKNRELWDKQQLLQVVIDESPDLILMKDWDGRVLYANRALAAYYGCTPDQVVGQHESGFNPDKALLEFNLEHERAVIRSCQPRIIQEERTDSRTGEVHFFQSAKTPLIGLDGGPRILVIAHDVTALHQAHQAVKEQEKRYAYAMAASDEGLWDWDCRENCVTHNDQWSELLGLDPSRRQYPFEGWLALVHEADRESVRAALDDALAGRCEFQHQYQMCRPDGRIIWVQDKGEVVERGWDGQALRMVGCIADITERRQAEDALRENEANFRAFFETLGDMIIVATADGRIQFTNKALEIRLGYSAGEVLLMSVLDLHSSERRLEVEEVFAAMLRGERSLCTIPLVTRDGSLVPVETRVWFGRWNGKECVFGLSKDLGPEIEAQQRFESLFRRSPALMALIALPERRFVDVNDTFLSTLGYSSDEVLGHTATEIGLFPELGAQQSQAARRVLEGESQSDCELKVRARDGKLMDGLFSAELLQSQGKQYSLAVMQDISERKQAELKLRQAASVFMSSQDGIMISDAEGRIIDVNPAFTRITGYERAEALGQNSSILSCASTPPELDEKIRSSLEQFGSWRGDLWSCRKGGERYAQLLSIDVVYGDDGAIAQQVAVFSDISIFKEHEAELDRIAHYDPLTGVPNRRLLSERLERAIAHAKRSGKMLAICYLDLDGFKGVNDRYGHAAGDNLLVEVATRLRKVLRDEDTLSRLGGDEFALLFCELNQVQDAEAVLERVLSEVSAPVAIDAQTTVNVSASIGVTFFPCEGADADSLLRCADQAMYQAKKAGKNNFQRFSA